MEILPPGRAFSRIFLLLFFLLNSGVIIHYGFQTGVFQSVDHITHSNAFISSRFGVTASEEKPEDDSWKSVKVLCFVETHPKNLEIQTKFIKMTWGPKCDVILYISDTFNETFPTIAVTNYTGYKSLWAKTRSTIQLLYDQYIDKAEWFLKADDDTYVIMNNLRKFLANKDTDKDLTYYGKFFAAHINGGYNSGGAGYVFGRRTLRRLVEKGFNSNTKGCPPVSEMVAEDITIGRCMHFAGVKCSRKVLDDQGRELFHSFSPEREFIIPWNRIPFYAQFSVHKLGGDNALPKNAISYHYVKGSAMVFLEYLFHNFTRHSVERV